MVQHIWLSNGQVLNFKMVHLVIWPVPSENHIQYPAVYDMLRLPNPCKISNYRYEKRESWSWVINLLRFLSEPAFVGFVGELMEATVLTAQERAAERCALENQEILFCVI